MTSAKRIKNETCLHIMRSIYSLLNRINFPDRYRHRLHLYLFPWIKARSVPQTMTGSQRKLLLFYNDLYPFGRICSSSHPAVDERDVLNRHRQNNNTVAKRHSPESKSYALLIQNSGNLFYLFPYSL